MNNSQLEVMIYQIAGDAMLRKNRTDGTGWEWGWGWADLQRDWMDATPNRFAYRCLPLSIANQTGWWIKNPVGFTAVWPGVTMPGTIEFQFDGAAESWSSWINNQFGQGIITWNTPFLFRTRPEGSRLLVCGPVNLFKTFVQPLTALIESDWMSMSFTMNWKIMVPNQPVRFEVGEPLFQAIPLVSNVCADLESASVTYQRLGEDPEVAQAYQSWHEGRRNFHVQKAKGDVKPDDWQKDYFHGRDALGQAPATVHMTKVKPPAVRFLPQEASSAVGVANAGRSRRGTEDEPCTPTAATNATVPEQQSAPATGGAESSASAGAVRVDDEWRRWIAENLMLEINPESLVAAMTASGIERDEAVREMQLAQQSPYVRGSEVLRNRLKKRI